MGSADVTIDYKFIGLSSTNSGYYMGLTRDSTNSTVRPYLTYRNGVTGSFKFSGAILQDETFSVEITSSMNNAITWDYCISYPGGVVRIS